MVRTLSDRSRRIVATCLGTLLLAMLLLLVSLNSKFEAEPPPKIATHEVRSYKPPPPPPPPPKKQQGGSNSPRPSLARARVETPVELEVMDLEADIGAGGIGGFGAGGTGDGNGDGLGSGSGGWEIVGISDLDNIPMVRSAGNLSYPEEAIRQNVPEFRIEVHIVIDEEGRAHPIRILKNPFPSMNKKVMKYVSSVTFTPPTKLGIPVKTAYLWPLRMKKPMGKKK